MKLELNGKKALVTGSSLGIGFEIAKTLHSEGCYVALNGREETRLTSAANNLPGAKAFTGDVTSAKEAAKLVNDVVSAFGGLDILVCNVGNGKSVEPGLENPAEWERVMASNFFSATNVIEAAKNNLVCSRGVVICVSSICGCEVVSGAPVTYSVAKAALNAYVRGVARPFGKLGVRINAVVPGNIFFKGSTWEKKIEDDESKVTEMLEGEVALGSFGSPLDVANLVVYLASSKCDFVTGTIWPIDGGQLRS